jgi:hypothetical protein
MNPSDDNPWDRLVAAARQRGATGSVAPLAEAGPPPGFAARLAARWADLRKNEMFRLWARWSLRAALAGLVVAGIVSLLPAPETPAPHPLSVPGVDTPSISSR